MRLTLQGGFLAVAIFFVISGYVCAMKPLKLSRARKPDEARKAIASAAAARDVLTKVDAKVLLFKISSS